LRVWAQACPVFVSLVEEGLAESPESRILAEYYLAQRPDIDTLILGCTHYPVLAPVLQQVVGPDVKLVSSAEVTAEAVAAELGPGDATQGGRVTHYVTGGVPAYQHTAEVIGDVEGSVIPLDVTRLADARHSIRHTLANPL
jgi:glutamate racemase